MLVTEPSQFSGIWSTRHQIVVAPRSESILDRGKHTEFDQLNRFVYHPRCRHSRRASSDQKARGCYFRVCLPYQCVLHWRCKHPGTQSIFLNYRSSPSLTHLLAPNLHTRTSQQKFSPLSIVCLHHSERKTNICADWIPSQVYLFEHVDEVINPTNRRN